MTDALQEFLAVVAVDQATRQVWVSPSQLETHGDCERKWAFKQVDKHRPDPTPKAQFGTEVHAEQSRWLKHGIPPSQTPAGRVAAQAIKPGWLPTPGPHLIVDKDHKTDIDIGDGVHLIGYPDLCVPPDLADPIPTIVDFKSTTDFRYAMDEEELSEDDQALIYCMDGMRMFNVRKARARWIYLAATNPKDPTKERKPDGQRKVEIVMDADDPKFQAAWADLVRRARLVAASKRRLVMAHEAEVNASSCENYGGCPHKARCGITPEDILVAHVAQIDRERPHVAGTVSEEVSMDLLNKLLSQAGAPAAAQPAPAAAPAQPAPAQAAPAPAAAPAATDGGVLGSILSQPPPAQPAPAPAQPAQPPPSMGSVFGAVAGATTINPPSGAGKAEPQPAAQPAAQTDQAPQTPAAAPASAPAQPAAQPATASAEPPGLEGLVVIYDALYARGGRQATLLVDWVRPLAEAVAKENQVPSFGLVEYGKGGEQLAAKVERMIDATKPTGVVLCQTATAEGLALKSVLMRKAAVFIQGTR